MADPDPAGPTPLNLSEVDFRHRNGVSHPKRNFHFCAFGCCLFIGSAEQDSSWNNASVHCHGDVILVRFFHMSSKNPPALRTLESCRTVDPSVPDARAILGESIVKLLRVSSGFICLSNTLFGRISLLLHMARREECELSVGEG
jgi:hypothetical protein